MLRRDGSIQSNNLPSPNDAYNRTDLDYKIYRCMIIEVYYADDQRNLSYGNPQVTYDCLIIGGRNEGQTIPNCKLVNTLGGQFNYHERVLRKTYKPFSGDNSAKLSEQKGDIVYVSFVGGRRSNPIIIGLGTHVLDVDATGATVEDGPIDRYEFNGVYHLTNKDGEYRFIRKGGTYNAEERYFTPADRAEEDGLPAPEELFQAKISFIDGIMRWEDPKSSITLSKDEQTYNILIGEKQSQVFVDGKNDLAKIKMAGGTLINVDGAGGVVTIDADGGGTNVITIDKSGTVTIKASSKVNIEAPLVDVGEGAAFSSTLFENLASEFAKHQHTGNLGAPTSPPNAPLISLVGSQSVKVKD
jgi:hypothetical protein